MRKWGGIVVLVGRGSPDIYSENKMTTDDLSLARNFARKVLILAAIDAMLATDQDSTMPLIDANEIILNWLPDVFDEAIEYATAIEQGRALLNYDRYSQNFELYDA